MSLYIFVCLNLSLLWLKVWNLRKEQSGCFGWITRWWVRHSEARRNSMGDIRWKSTKESAWVCDQSIHSDGGNSKRLFKYSCKFRALFRVFMFKTDFSWIVHENTAYWHLLDIKIWIIFISCHEFYLGVLLYYPCVCVACLLALTLKHKLYHSPMLIENRGSVSCWLLQETKVRLSGGSSG